MCSPPSLVALRSTQPNLFVFELHVRIPPAPLHPGHPTRRQLVFARSPKTGLPRVLCLHLGRREEPSPPTLLAAVSPRVEIAWSLQHPPRSRVTDYQYPAASSRSWCSTSSRMNIFILRSFSPLLLRTWLYVLFIIVQLLSTSVHVVGPCYVKTLEASFSFHSTDCSSTLTYL
jgi:hypothetical protein